MGCEDKKSSTHFSNIAYKEWTVLLFLFFPLNLESIMLPEVKLEGNCWTAFHPESNTHFASRAYTPDGVEVVSRDEFAAAVARWMILLV